MSDSLCDRCSQMTYIIYGQWHLHVALSFASFPIDRDMKLGADIKVDRDGEGVREAQAMKLKQRHCIS